MDELVSARNIITFCSVLVNVLAFLLFFNMDYKDRSTLIACNMVNHEEFCTTARALDQNAHTGLGMSPNKIMQLVNPDVKYN